MIHVEEITLRADPQPQSFPPTGGDATAFAAALHAALPRVRVPRIRQDLGHVADLLATARASGFAGSLSRSDAPPQVRDAFRAVLQTVTVAERDAATDEVVLAITFAINGDDAAARAHLATLGTF